jgi:hypothetical protein
MKAYVKFEYADYLRHPEDTKKIINYLSEHGRLLVREDTVEDLYYKFCDEKFSAGWMSTDEDNLEYFADWLADLDF